MIGNWEKVGILAATLLVLVLVFANVEVASAHKWWKWHWHKPPAPTLSVGIWSYVTEADAARDDWDSHTKLLLPRQYTHPTSTSPRISVWGKNYGKTGWSGLATIALPGGDWPWHCGGAIWCRIQHAHARYNSYYGGTGGAGAGSSIRGVLCQEIGHAFGLDHSNTGDCMGKSYYNNINVTGSHNWDDINAWY